MGGSQSEAVVKYDGSSWTVVPSVTNNRLSAIDFTDPDHGWIGGSNNSILRYCKPSTFIGGQESGEIAMQARPRIRCVVSGDRIDLAGFGGILAKAAYRIYSLHGKVVRTNAVPAASIDVSMLPAGAYVLRVSGKGIGQTLRFLKR